MIDRFTDWYFIIDRGHERGLIRGLFSTPEIREFLKTGEITENYLIRYGKNSPWQLLRDVPRFTTVGWGISAKRIMPELWKKFGVFILVAGLIVFAVNFAQVPSPRNFLNAVGFLEYPLKSDNSIEHPILPETLNKEAIIALTNNARALHGLPPLRENQQLDIIAESRVRDMLEKQYFAHVSPAGIQASDIAQSVGYHYKIIAENIANGDFRTNRKIIDGWMQSPGHRQNILNPEVEEIGAGVAKGKMKGGQTYVVVQIFGLQSLPVSEHKCVPPPKNLFDEIELRKAEMAGLIERSNRLRQELDMERETIEADRKYTYDDPQKIYDLNVKVNAYNEKNKWLGRIVTDATAKSAVLESMVNEYNRLLRAYNDCLTSK